MGLVAYDSNSEEEEEEDVNVVPITTKAEGSSAEAENKNETISDVPPAAPVSGPAMGPAMGPSIPPDTSAYDLPEPEEEEEEEEENFTNLTAAEERAAARMLTLPITTTSLPSGLFLPPSSTALSNCKAIAALESKKSGIHFNQKLNSSIPFRNPAIATKLSQLLGDDNTAQYVNVLPESIWNPKAISNFQEHLAVMDAVTTLLAKPRAKGQPVMFVSATVDHSGDSNQVGLAGSKRKAGAE